MFWLFLAEFSKRALKAILLIFIARLLGVFQFGQLSFATAFTVIFSIIANFGFGEINTRQLSQNQEQDNNAVISLQWTFSLVCLLLILILSSIFITDPIILKLTWALAVVVVFNEMAEFLFSFFRANNKFIYEAIAKAIQGILTTGLGLLILFISLNILYIILAYILGMLVMFLVVFYFYNRHFDFFKFKFNKETWIKYIKMSWPVGSMTVFALIYNYMDSVMLGFYNQITEVGWYNAAHRIVFIVMLVPVLITRGFYPIMSKKFKHPGFRKVFFLELILMLITAIILVGAGIACSPLIINIVYGAEYAPAIPAFVMLLLMSGTYFIIYLMYQILIVSNNQRKIFWISLIGMVLNIILNFILIPKYSLYGVAAATLITYITMMVLSVCEARRFI